MDICVYVADKIADNRKGERNQLWRRLAYTDLKSTYERILKELVWEHREKGHTIPLQTKKALEKLEDDSDMWLEWDDDQN